MFNSLVSQMLIVALTISGIPLLLSSISGLIISILQAATSVQDQSISYLVRLTTLILTFLFCGNWFMSQILALIRQMLSILPVVSG